jgi:hypothetical protein
MEDGDTTENSREYTITTDRYSLANLRLLAPFTASGCIASIMTYLWTDAVLLRLRIDKSWKKARKRFYPQHCLPEEDGSEVEQNTEACEEHVRIASFKPDHTPHFHYLIYLRCQPTTKPCLLVAVKLLTSRQYLLTISFSPHQSWQWCVPVLYNNGSLHGYISTDWFYRCLHRSNRSTGEM